MTDLAGHPALRNLANPLSAFLAILLLTVLITFSFRYYALQAADSERTSRWKRNHFFAA
jgi:hypothetical protein